jgi:hypothetical protein
MKQLHRYINRFTAQFRMSALDGVEMTGILLLKVESGRSMYILSWKVWKTSNDFPLLPSYLKPFRMAPATGASGKKRFCRSRSPRESINGECLKCMDKESEKPGLKGRDSGACDLAVPVIRRTMAVGMRCFIIKTYFILCLRRGETAVKLQLIRYFIHVISVPFFCKIKMPDNAYSSILPR